MTALKIQRVYLVHLKWVNQSTIQHILSMWHVCENALGAVKYIFLNNQKVLLGSIYDFNYYRV